MSVRRPAFASHSICNDCYARRHPGRVPYRLMLPHEGPPSDQCCYCGLMHNSRIYVRGATSETTRCTCQ